MGTDKASLSLGNANDVTLLDHMVALAQTAAAGLQDRATVIDLRVSGNRPNYPSIPDRISGMGPLSGIASTLDFYLKKPPALRPELALFLPIDMPLLSPQAIRTLLCSLLEVFPGASQGAFHESALAAAFEASELPLVCRIAENVRSILGRCLEQPNKAQRSIRAFLEATRANRLPIAPENSSELHNANTPEEWSRVRLSILARQGEALRSRNFH